LVGDGAQIKRIALGRFGDPFDFRRGDLRAARLQDVTHLGKIERAEFIQFVGNREGVLEQFVQTFAGPGSYHKESTVGKSVTYQIGRFFGDFGGKFVEGIDQNYNPAFPKGNRFQEFLEGLGQLRDGLGKFQLRCRQCEELRGERTQYQARIAATAGAVNQVMDVAGLANEIGGEGGFPLPGCSANNEVSSIVVLQKAPERLVRVHPADKRSGVLLDDF
jgi:hypothetical protein